MATLFQYLYIFHRLLKILQVRLEFLFIVYKHYLQFFACFCGLLDEQVCGIGRRHNLTFADSRCRVSSMEHHQLDQPHIRRHAQEIGQLAQFLTGRNHLRIHKPLT